MIIGVVKSIGAQSQVKHPKLEIPNDLNTLDQSIIAADDSIKSHSSKGNIYLGIIALLVLSFVYFIFYSITSDVSSINNYLDKQTRINFMYQEFFKEYIGLIEKR